MSLPFPAAVIQAVLQAGVGEFVICAGARNSALVVVLAGLGDKVRLWQHFDERAAGFFAIGRIRATECPVAVVTTSGTAAAELLPAVIEAHYQGLPLVALTADRPKRYRGSGAPQAIEQRELFRPYAAITDIQESEPPDLHGWQGLSPLHFNVCLEEIESAAHSGLRIMLAGPATGRFGEHMGEWKWPRDRPVSAAALVIAGEMLDHESPLFSDMSVSHGALIYTEAASGLRDREELQPLLIRCGDSSLRHLPVEAVMRYGGVPAARYWRDLEQRPEISVSSCSRSGHAGLARKSHDVKPFRPEPKDEGEIVIGLTIWGVVPPHIPAADYLARDAALYTRLGELLTRFPDSEPALFRRLSQVIPQSATVFTGNSLAVREWNLCAEYGRGHRVHVLRGANGIDGNLSAFLGIAADKEESWCITGDLTALYDLSAPWMLNQLPAGRRRFVVVQNGGGKIFSRLPSLRGLNERERTLMENPHNISLRGWAEMWSMDHVSGSAGILDNLSALADHAVIELHPDAEQTEAFWIAWAEAEKEIWS